MIISGYLKHSATALAIAALMPLTGCIFESGAPEPVEPVERANEVILCLNVEVPKAGASRADDNDPDYYEGPEGDFEKIRTLRVIIVNHPTGAQGRETGTIEGNRLVFTDEFGNPKYDNFNFKVQADQKKRIYLVANEAMLTPPENSPYETASEFLDSYKLGMAEANIAALIDWTVSLPQPNPKTGASVGLFHPELPDSRLPLSESFDIFVERNVIENTTGQTEDYCYANLFLTRAAAKASFYVSTSSTAEADYTITALSLKGVGVEEYVFPLKTDYSPAKYDEADKVSVVENNERYIKSFETPTTNTTTYFVEILEANIKQLIEKGQTIILNGEKGSSVYIPGSLMYFPESILSGEQKYEVGVQLNGDDDLWLYAPLKTNILSINGSDAIARDTHLKINITLNNVNGNITCEVKLVPYISVVLNPWFGFEEPYPPFTPPTTED